jgi:hypothetical protein
MGSSASPPLAIVMCAFGEYMWTSSIRTKNVFYGLRYVDDRWTVEINNGKNKNKVDTLKAGASTCYDSRLKLELVEEGTGVHMLESIITYDSVECKFKFEYWNKNWDSLVERGVPKIKRWIDYCSFGLRREKVSLVIGILAKLERLCTNVSDLMIATVQLSLELRFKGYPWSITTQAIQQRRNTAKFT